MMMAEKQNRTVLVTGASGYIGMHCILKLLQEGYAVRGTLRTPARESKLRETFARHIDADDRLSFVTADLSSDAGWAEAARDCRTILHVASPNPTSLPRDEEAIIRPAVDGTMRVLEAATNAGVKRVVITSSMATVVGGNDPRGKIFTEADWADLDGQVDAYTKSKTLAERAAGEFVAGLPDGKTVELVVINPSYVIGPILDEDIPTSVEIVYRFMTRQMPGIPRIGFELVDVRDLADAHFLAMTAPQAAGKRFLCSAEYYTAEEIAAILQKHFAARGYRLPTRSLPDFLIRLMALFDGGVKRIAPTLGLRFEASSDLLKNTLDWRPRPVEEAIVDTAESLIEFGLV
jgi:nucleoside-diphosphate-sugar epimerase